MNDKQKKLLDMLIKQQGVVTAESFSNSLGISKRSVYSYLDVVTPYLKEKGYELIKVPSKGVKVVKSGSGLNKNIDTFDEYSPDSRRYEIFSRVLIHGKKVTINELCGEFFVSESSIRKDVAFFQDLLKDFPSVNILINKGEIVCEYSDVATLINAIIYINETLSSRYMFDEKVEYWYRLYDLNIVDVVIKAVKTYLKKLNINLADHYVSHICSVMITLVSFIKDGKHIESNGKILAYDRLKALPNTLLASQFLECIGRELSLSFNEHDAEFLSDYLMADRFDIDNFDKIDDNDMQIYREILNKLEKTIDIKIDENDILVKNLLLHLNAMVFRLRNQITVSNSMKEDIRQEFGSLFNLIMIILGSVEDKLKIKVNDDEVAYLLIHVENIIEQQKKIKNILLVCPHGIVASNLIANRIKDFLPSYNFIEAVSISQMHEINLESVDFIVSTVDIPDAKKPVIKVSPILSKEDQINVMNFYQNLVFDSSPEIFNYDYLRKYISDDLVFEIDANSKEEIISYICKKMVLKGVVTSEYESDVLNREALDPTDNVYAFAIPHGDMKHVKKMKLVIALLKEPIKWESYNVSIVVFVNINQSGLHDSKKVLDDVFHLMQSRNFAQLLKSGITKKEFLNFIGG